MSNWIMLTLVGKDQPGIVADITQILYKNQANLGEAQMQRLGGYFTIMLMVEYSGSQQALESCLQPCKKQYDLSIHSDAIHAELHQHWQPNVRINVYGADRMGIVAAATAAMVAAGLHILDLQTDVAGTADKPIFIMQVEGYSEKGITSLTAVFDRLEDMDVQIEPLETLLA